MISKIKIEVKLQHKNFNIYKKAIKKIKDKRVRSKEKNSFNLILLKDADINLFCVLEY